MEFTHKKLPPEAAAQMRVCPISTVHPFALMLAPTYVFMKRNAKFVAVKAPLDFFVPEELERMRPFQTFFMPEFVDRVLPFREAARKLRGVLTWQPAIKPNEVALPPTPYELSDAALRLIGPLWGEGTAIEPFFVAAFVNELCELLPGDRLRTGRDSDVKRYEAALLSSSLAVFLALHLGMCELAFLNRLRVQVFNEVLDGSTPDSGGDVREVIEFAKELGSNRSITVWTPADLGLQEDSSSGVTRIQQKLASRLMRVSRDFVKAGVAAASVRGPGGFIDNGITPMVAAPAPVTPVEAAPVEAAPAEAAPVEAAPAEAAPVDGDPNAAGTGKGGTPLG